MRENEGGQEADEGERDPASGLFPPRASRTADRSYEMAVTLTSCSLLLVRQSNRTLKGELLTPPEQRRCRFEKLAKNGKGKDPLIRVEARICCSLESIMPSWQSAAFIACSRTGVIGHALITSSEIDPLKSNQL